MRVPGWAYILVFLGVVLLAFGLCTGTGVIDVARQW